MNHEHKECDHKILYCSKCDVCYCEKCQKEWLHFTINVPTVWYRPSVQPTWIGDGTYPTNPYPSVPATTPKYNEYPTITVNHTHEGSA